MNISRQALKYMLLGIAKVHIKDLIKEVFNEDGRVISLPPDNKNIQTLEITLNDVVCFVVFNFDNNADACICIEYNLFKDGVMRVVVREIPISNSLNEYVITDILDMFKHSLNDIKECIGK